MPTRLDNFRATGARLEGQSISGYFNCQVSSLQYLIYHSFVAREIRGKEACELGLKRLAP